MTETNLECRCNWKGYYIDLNRERSLERNHPLNKNIVSEEDAHITDALKCPNCGRWLFADEVPTTNLRGV